MKISSVNILEDYSGITVTITEASNATSLLFWNDTTYKDYTKAIDFTSRLSGDATQVLTITLDDIKEPYLDGIYFFEATDPVDISLEYDYLLNRYKECIIDRIILLNNCDSCLNEENKGVINAHSLLTSLEYALEERFTEEIITIVKMLNKYCNNVCNTCGRYNTITTSDSNENNSPLDIKVDGGSLD